MVGTPSDDVLTKKIKVLVSKIDLQTTGVKQFIKLLSEEFGVDLKPRKEFIKKALTVAIDANNQQDDDDDDVSEQDADDDDDNDDDEPEPKKKRAALTAKNASGRGTGLSAQKEISDKLASFLRQGNVMSRTDVVKSLWEYIREHDLQNPENKREIILDGPMKKVFGCDTFTMFTMNKYISAHVHPFKPVDLSVNSTVKKPKASGKRKGKGEKGGKEKKKRKAGTQPPYRLSDELQVVVKESILPRPQVVSKLWVYIKEHNLQNEQNKREILCDAKLKAIMKKSKVTMFEMNALITNHLIEKVDRSEYNHKEEEVDEDSVVDDASEEEEDVDESD